MKQPQRHVTTVAKKDTFAVTVQRLLKKKNATTVVKLAISVANVLKIKWKAVNAITVASRAIFVVTVRKRMIPLLMNAIVAMKQDIGLATVRIRIAIKH